MNYLYVLILFAAKNVDCSTHRSFTADSIFKGLKASYLAKTTVPQPRHVPEINKKECIDSADYLKVSEMPYYVDKTAFISKVMGDTRNLMIFCAPRRFSKSTFLSMMSNFLSPEIMKNDKITDSTPAQRLNSKTMKSFKNKAVFSDEQGNQLSDEAIKANDLFLKHFENHPVIYADFSTVSGIYYKDMYVDLHDVIVNACLKHYYIFKNESLWSSSSMLETFKHRYCTSQNDPTTILAGSITGGFWELSKKLHDHFGKTVVVLIDEVDAPTTAALLNENFSTQDIRNVDKIIKFSLTKMCKKTEYNQYIEKVIVTSISSLNAAQSQEPVNMKRIRFLQNEEYDLLFGFTGYEVEKMIKSESGRLKDKDEYFNEADFIEDTAIWFDGYKTINGVSIYNPWSVVNTVTSGIFKRYWAMPLDRKEFLSLIIHPKILPTMWCLLAGDIVKMKMEEGEVENANIPALMNLREILHHGKVSNPSVFFKYLCETGYLSCKILDDDENLIMKIPNYEISKQLHREMFSYQQAQESYTIPACLMENIGHTFTSIASIISNSATSAGVFIPKDESHYRQSDANAEISAVKQWVQHLASNLHLLHEVVWSRFENIGWGTITDLNFHLVGHNFKWALCVILKRYFLTCEDGTQQVLKEEPVKSGKGRIDIVVKTHGTVFIIELKYGRNSEVALKQCIDNDYLSILPSASDTGNQHPYMILGINFRKDQKKTVDVSYLHNCNNQSSLQTVSA